MTPPVTQAAFPPSGQTCQRLLRACQASVVVLNSGCRLLTEMLSSDF